MRIQTKIICTIGPSVHALDQIIALIQAGMSVARLNFSHGSYDEHRQVIANLKEARERLGVPLAIMLDTKGPEVRVGVLSQPLKLTPGQVVTLAAEGSADKPLVIPITPPTILANLKEGVQVLFDDGYISGRVVGMAPEGVLIEIQDEGELKSGKGINIPDVPLDLPMITERDEADLLFGCEQDIDLIAASFVNSSEHILAIKRLVKKEGRPDTLIVAKIESSRGVNHLDAILGVADGIMIARGDLGVEVPLSRVPGLQKMMIKKCAAVGKPSIIATQMLDSMTYHSRPTRAEASDVANAIHDSSSAVMLSGETAVGRYPIQTVQVMSEIIADAESAFDYQHYQSSLLAARSKAIDVSSAVSLASLKTAQAAGAKAIFVITSRGRTARLIARLRPPVPILALTASKKVYHQLAFEWGVVPVYDPDCSRLEDAIVRLGKWAQKNGYVREGDLVVITVGVPFVSGTTNTMIVESIGNVLVRCRGGYGRRAEGKVLFLEDVEAGSLSEVEGKILLIRRCSDEYLPFVRVAKAVILEDDPDDLHSERYLLLVAKALDLSCVTGADAATHILRQDLEVIVDPTDGIVYSKETKEHPPLEG